MNHTRLPKEDHLPDWERRDNKVTKGDRVDYQRPHRLICPPHPLIWSVPVAVCEVVKLPDHANDHNIPSSSDQLELISLWYRLGASTDCFSEQLCLRGLPLMFCDVIIQHGGRLSHLHGGRRTVGVLFFQFHKKFFNYQLMHKRIDFRGILKFTLKLQQLQHVSVWSPPSGSALCELAEVTVVKHLVEIYHCVANVEFVYSSNTTIFIGRI